MTHYVRQVLVPGIGPEGQARIERARVSIGAPAGEDDGHEQTLMFEVAREYAERAGFAEVTVGLIDRDGLAPIEIVSTDAAREVVAASRAVVAAIRAAARGEGG